MRSTFAISCAVLALTAATSHGAFELKVSEIWMGNEPGSNLTEDWIEVTNYGDMAWNLADGELYYDDDSADPDAADLMAGISTIAAGESVIFVNGSATVGETNVTDFMAAWGAAATGLQIGTFDGSGLGQGGDGATLFVSNGQPLLDFTNVISVDLQLYPDANAFGGQSWDVALQAFSTVGNAAGAVSSALANDVNQFGVASLGSVVPEPTALVLGAFALIAAASTRRAGA
ncbi:hypothetical protein Pla108_33960 [Botrimarina colliarenosi]|uniref:PEP-CTERM protein-sorting domain-containing protein n=1 Tax=Botrimarina colliarenosi TaxID=2528001 RepID=A0A5C6A5J4_9BACT|nr:hypothetical protein [Botrimarina colliarenosi]TWT95252.1 hypothetical protein Pla108_33960 [Botrimarina colliarenosi]